MIFLFIEEHGSRSPLYFMKILLCLFANINWILSMLIPASRVLGSLQVRGGQQRGTEDWQEVPSFLRSQPLLLWGEHLISPLQPVSPEIQGKYRKALCQFWLSLLWTLRDLLQECEVNLKRAASRSFVESQKETVLEILAKIGSLVNSVEKK